MPTSPVAPKRKFNWIIIAIIVVGGVVASVVYGLWQQAAQPTMPDKAGENSQMPLGTPPIPVVPPEPMGAGSGDSGDKKTMVLGQYSESTEVPAIEQDLQNTNLSGLDAEMTAMAQELR